MKLVDVYSAPDAPRVLYELLAEREPHQNISHKEMPPWDDHCAFVASRPYEAWYLIVDDAGAGERVPRTVGAIYLTKRREVGVFVFRTHQGNGYGARAISLLSQAHPGRLLANVAPGNVDSAGMFQRCGFRPLQVTYERA